jgi:hypothetical protein
VVVNHLLPKIAKIEKGAEGRLSRIEKRNTSSPAKLGRTKNEFICQTARVSGFPSRNHLSSRNRKPRRGPDIYGQERNTSSPAKLGRTKHEFICQTARVSSFQSRNHLSSRKRKPRRGPDIYGQERNTSSPAKLGRTKNEFICHPENGKR